MKEKTAALITLALCIILALIAAVMAVSLFGGGDGRKENIQTEAADATAQPEEKESGGLFQRATPTPEPTPEATPVPTPEPTATPRPGPEVPAQDNVAPADYFANSAFVGNSVVTGLDMYDYDDVLAGAEFYAANSVTVLGVADYVAQMAGNVYDRVYVGLGTNEMSYDKDILRGCFNDMIDTLFGYNPDCQIYLMAVTPVSEYKSSTNSMFTRELVIEFNEMLREIAEDRGVWYLDEFSVLANDNGYLPSEVTVDGIHFTPAHYEYWFDYLRTHYIPDAAASAVQDTPAEPAVTDTGSVA